MSGPGSKESSLLISGLPGSLPLRVSVGRVSTYGERTGGVEVCSGRRPVFYCPRPFSGLYK